MGREKGGNEVCILLIFSTLAVVMVTVFSGKTYSLVTPARGGGPTCTGVNDAWSLPALKGSVSLRPGSLTCMCTGLSTLTGSM